MGVRGSGICYRGPKGQGVASATINSAGHLIIKYDDPSQTTQDAGLVDGAAGASVLVGSGAPSAAVGHVTDVYIDAVTGDIYRKES